MKNKAESISRIPQLDGIRGLAVMMVIFDHASYWYPHPPEQIAMADTASGILRPILKLTSNGWLGVDLFFILSGYLITSILLKTRNGNAYFESFYARRVLRILPVFWLTLFTIGFIFPNGGEFLAVSFVFLANVSGIFGQPSLYYPLWSLCVEEHFYFIWPFVVKIVERRTLLIIAAFICLVEPLLRAIFAWHMGTAFFGWPWYFTGFRCEGLAYGALLAIIAPELSNERRTRLGLVAMACGAAIFLAGIPLGILHSSESLRAVVVHATAGVTFASVFFFGLVCFALGLSESRARIFANTPLMQLGKLSYFLYLSHQLVFWGWDHWFGYLRDGAFASRPAAYFVVRFLACVAFSCLLAQLSWMFIESPILALKRYFPAHRKVKELEPNYQTA